MNLAEAVMAVFVTAMLGAVSLGAVASASRMVSMLEEFARARSLAQDELSLAVRELALGERPSASAAFADRSDPLAVRLEIAPVRNRLAQVTVSVYSPSGRLMATFATLQESLLFARRTG